MIYFPFDWRWSVRRSLKAINPSVVVIMETELWPNFFRECKAREIPVALVNGRISRTSFGRYLKIRFFLRRVLECLSVAVMQSEQDAERIRALGMREGQIFSVGNLKFEAAATEKNTGIEERFGLDKSVPLVLAASTHAPEEKIVIESFKRLRKRHATVRLMIAPRRPERFNEVAELIEASGLSWTRRTNEPAPEDKSVAVILLDTIGELTSVYQQASVVFVGGSIVDRGGHNVLEPAAHGVAMITGAHTHNFHAIVALLKDAIVQLQPLEGEEMVIALSEAMRRLLDNAELRIELGSRAKQLVAANQGATEKTMKLIAPLFSQAKSGNSRSDSLLPANAT